MTFIQAKNFGSLRGNPTMIVIHDMEAPEKGETAENVARYFSTLNKPASAHYCIDNNSIVQCVQDQRVAYHAPGANKVGLGFEHAGYARQAAHEWFDAYSMAMLDNSTNLAAMKCVQYGIPARYIPAASLKAGDMRGITTHRQVSLAFGLSDHSDPGPSFPVDWYVQTVASKLSGPVVQPRPDASALQALAQAIAFARIHAQGVGFRAFDGQGATTNLNLGVVLIQAALNSFARTLANPLLWAVPETGVFDGRTYDLVKFYQVAHQLPGTGVVDGLTFGKMYP